ncbi:MAG: hypothetical protein QF907_01960 [Nitrospinota bacterium]|jgi:hypothetical protein|nr:hypothetical protein [Nitrospinota bacterium]MDP7581370.1 hypothetical protein [Nitrospinota bacterium]HJN01527.1 hypothetical protein [Nitrospinota bacterium]|tara:strand:- start:641 stop:1759 length:1119 start_codon:yes stop_codon:yes gene_type:complete
MFKKILAGFIVMALAFTSVPVTSDAAVQVGDNLKLFGDFRMRVELEQRDYEAGSSATTDSRERPRMRARFGGTYQTSLPNVSFTFGMAGNGGMDTLAHGSSNFQVDAAHVNVGFADSGVFIFGQLGFPLWQQTEVYWDQDNSVEGYVAAYTASLGDAGSLTAAAAYLYVTNQGWQGSWFDNDTLTAWQVTHKGSFNGASTTLAFAGIHANDGADGTVFRPGGSTNTDATPEPSWYQASGQIKMGVDDYKVLLGADYNFSDWTETGDDNDQGYVLQARIGKGAYGVRYYYYDIEEASVPFHGTARLTQDNISCSTWCTGVEAHRVQLSYKISSDVNTHFKFTTSEGKTGNNFTNSETADRTANRYQLDFNFKF